MGGSRKETGRETERVKGGQKAQTAADRESLCNLFPTSRGVSSILIYYQLSLSPCVPFYFLFNECNFGRGVDVFHLLFENPLFFCLFLSDSYCFFIPYTKSKHKKKRRDIEEGCFF